MSAWIQCVLREAVSYMQENSRNDLALSLTRLCNSPIIVDAQVFLNEQCEAIADEILDTDNISDFQKSLIKVSREFEADHCAVNMIRETGQASYSMKSIATHKSSWTKAYVSARFGSIDPIIHRCRADVSPFFWDSVSSSDPFTKHYFHVAQGYGVGPNGYTVPLKNKFGDIVAVSLSSTAERYNFENKFSRKRSDFDDVAPLLVDVYTDLVGVGHQNNVSLTEDHLRVLHKLASGVSFEEVSAGICAFGSFQNIEKSILQILCAKNLTQAVVIATELGILRDLPYFEYEMSSLEESDDSHPHGNDRLPSSLSVNRLTGR